MKNLSLNQKIWSTLGLLILAFVVTTAFALKSMMTLRDYLNEITGTIVKRDQLTSEIRDNQRRIVILCVESIVFTKEDILKKNEADFQKAIQKQDEDIKSFHSIADEHEKEIIGRYASSYQKFLESMHSMREFALKNKNDEASGIYQSTRETLIVEMRKNVEELHVATAKTLNQMSAEANSNAAHALWLSIFIFIASVTVSVVIAALVLRSLSQAISEVVKNLSDGSAQVTSAATQIASASQELSQATTEQAAALEQTAASVEEMNSMVSKNTDNAASTAELSGKSTDASNRGKLVVEKMIQSMEQIDKSNATIMEQVNESNKQVAGIVKVIEQIAKKTQVINDIVNKTELLSFNASVEAARAGEHGKGFAVVAEEVGNLARMSGSAAEEISALIDSSVENVNKIVQETASKVSRLIEDGKTAVEQGTSVAHQCNDVLNEIVTNVGTVSTMSSDIASASQEQSRGINEITKAMAQLDQMTQQNAATSEECAAAAEELSAQSEMLKNTVTHLVITVNGGHADQSAHAATPTSTGLSRVQKITERSAKRPAIATSMKKSKFDESSVTPLKKVAGDVPSYDSEGFQEN